MSRPGLAPLLALALAVAAAPACGGGGDGGTFAGGGDVTGRLELVGNPLRERYPDGEAIYARNPWDLEVHAGRLFVGGGNSSNEGPAINSGPVPLFAYDPVGDRFVEETVIEDEQVDVFHVLGGVLQTGGHDPLEGWLLGNRYLREDASAAWIKERTIPRGIHTYALASRDGQLFAGLGTPAGATVAVSDDGGRRWDSHRASGYRVRAFLEPADGGLYATGIFDPSLEGVGFHAVAAWSGAGFEEREDLDVAALFPGAALPAGRNARVVKPVRLGEVAVYLGGVVHNDHQFLPLGLYSARSLARGAIDVRAHDPVPGAEPWDVVVDGQRVLALYAVRAGAAWAATVVASRDLETWTELFRFESPALARSLAVLEGAFYVGLGCEIADPDDWSQDELDPATGELWRLR